MDKEPGVEEEKKEAPPNEYNGDLHDDRRIQVLKEIILVREEKQLNKLFREFQRENDVDGSMGECCCNWPNAEGAIKIQTFDRLFIVNLPRFVMAHRSSLNPTRFALYARFRYISMLV